MICIQLLKGLGSTCLIFTLTLLLSLPLGLLVCFGRMSRFKPLQYVFASSSPFCAARRSCCS